MESNKQFLALENYKPNLTDKLEKVSSSMLTTIPESVKIKYKIEDLFIR